MMNVNITRWNNFRISMISICSIRTEVLAKSAEADILIAAPTNIKVTAHYSPNSPCRHSDN